MSFFIGNTSNNSCRPGPIRNAGCGNVCEKALIEVTKVFDACVSQTTETGLVLTATDFTPASPALPLTFVSAEASGAPTLANTTIVRSTERPNFATVTTDVTIPLSITYRDANNVVGVASSSITFTRSAVLFVPQPAMTPVSIAAMASLISTIGTFTDPDTFTINACVYIILKVVATVDMLVPSYGYPCFPTCQEPLSTVVCPGVNTLPIFPSAT